MIKWHHYPISLKYNSATPRKAICIQLMLPRIKPAQYYFMPHITPLSSHFIMTMMKRETTGLIIPFPTEKSISICLHPL